VANSQQALLQQLGADLATGPDRCAALQAGRRQAVENRSSGKSTPGGSSEIVVRLDRIERKPSVPALTGNRFFERQLREMVEHEAFGG